MDQGKVLQELPLFGGSIRRSLRDRKGDRSERVTTRNGSAKAAIRIVSTERTSPRADQPSATPIDNLSETSPNADSGAHVLTAIEDVALQQEGSDQVQQSSALSQPVLDKGDLSSTASPQAPNSTLDDLPEESHSSFDPDSPLPVSRAPRHSLLLSLTASPLHFDQTSPSKSSSASPSPSRDEPLFAPEYHSMTTPVRVRQTPGAAAFGITDTPLGQATSRRRDARTLRREQATMERQATISNKLTAVSLAMSGLKASAYGTSSIEPRSPLQNNETRDDHYPPIQTDTKEGNTRNLLISENTVILERPCSTISEGEGDSLITALAVTRARSKSPAKKSSESQGGNFSRPTVSEMGQSRIPKSVVPPSQPVFRKPTISGLPILKPSMLPTKSLLTDTAQKAAPTITMAYKAVRPEGGLQPELARFATPVKGRLPSNLAFRSPAMSRVVSATNPAKPIHARSVSGSMTSSVSGAVRPMTPGKNLSRSVSAGESAAMTPRRGISDAGSTLPQLEFVSRPRFFCKGSSSAC